MAWRLKQIMRGERERGAREEPRGDQEAVRGQETTGVAKWLDYQGSGWGKGSSSPASWSERFRVGGGVRCAGRSHRYSIKLRELASIRFDMSVGTSVNLSSSVSET